MPAKSNVVAWGVASPDHDDLDSERYQGRLADEVVDDVVLELVGYLGIRDDR